MNAFVNRILQISEKKTLSEYDLPLPVQKKPQHKKTGKRTFPPLSGFFR